MLTEFLKKHQLPETFLTTANQYYIPLAQALLLKSQQNNSPLFVGVNGCQGSGKSTLTDFLSDYLTTQHNLTVINLSLDDFYLSKLSRQELAKTTHKLLATRGVPGTHDVELLKTTLSALKDKHVGLALSKFNKATDDLYPQEEWQLTPKNVDVVLFEGWCWGVTAQSEQSLEAPVNTLEESQDGDGRWRQYVNQQLQLHYQTLYSMMDTWLMLKAPSFNCVANWRWQQEEKLAAKQKNTTSAVMNKTQVMNFIQYYQRLTQHSLESLPEKCDWILQLDSKRNITNIINKDGQ
jgi:D-glycerate 3-kinase